MVQPTVETRASTGATPLVVGHYLWKAAMGGIERLVLDLADEQRRSGAVDPTIVFGSEGGAWREHYDAHRVEVVGLKSGAQLSLRAYTRLRRIFERLDVLHMHAYHPLVGLAAAHSGTPVVFTLHGGFGKGREGTWRHRIRHGLQARFLRRGVGRITANSRFTAAEAVERYRLSVDAPCVVYNGTQAASGDAELDDPELRAWCRAGFVVGTAGRLEPRKRIDLILEAVARCREDSVRALVVGDGTERAALEEHARALGVADRVRFAGAHPSATPFQQLMDVCVVPSSEEAFGLAAIEGLALGVPVLVMRDGGGLLEIVEPLEPADVVDDADALARRIDEYAAGAANAVTADERRRYVERFGVSAMERRFQTLYEEVR